jgi:hypothetical protein
LVPQFWLPIVRCHPSQSLTTWSNIRLSSLTIPDDVTTPNDLPIPDDLTIPNHCPQTSTSDVDTFPFDPEAEVHQMSNTHAEVTSNAPDSTHSLPWSAAANSDLSAAFPPESIESSPAWSSGFVSPGTFEQLGQMLTVLAAKSQQFPSRLRQKLAIRWPTTSK